MIRVRHQIAVLVALLLVLLVASAQASAPSQSSTAVRASAALAASDIPGGGVGIWHRYSILSPSTTFEHERLVVSPVSDNVVYSARYDKVRETLPGFQWDSNQGYFQGADVTDTWSKPAWFPSSISDVQRVIHGQMVFVNPGVHSPFFVDQDLIFTGSGPTARMYIQAFWGVCPWFKTFEQALAANPTGSSDCIQQPAP